MRIAHLASPRTQSAELYKNPAFNAAITFLEPLPVGLIIALVSAGILRRRRGSHGAGPAVEQGAVAT